VTFYWEHLGPLNDPAYRARWARWEEKRAEYLKAGITLSRDLSGSESVLIETRDQPGGGLDAAEIARFVEKCVLTSICTKLRRWW
jgi:hypothetical protein